MAKSKEKLHMPKTDRRISTQPIRMMIRKMTRNLRRSHSIRAKNTTNMVTSIAETLIHGSMALSMI